METSSALEDYFTQVFFKPHVVLNLILSHLWNTKGEILKKCTGQFCSLNYNE